MPASKIKRNSQAQELSSSNFDNDHEKCWTAPSLPHPYFSSTLSTPNHFHIFSVRRARHTFLDTIESHFALQNEICLTRMRFDSHFETGISFAVRATGTSHVSDHAERAVHLKAANADEIGAQPFVAPAAWMRGTDFGSREPTSTLERSNDCSTTSEMKVRGWPDQRNEAVRASSPARSRFRFSASPRSPDDRPDCQSNRVDHPSNQAPFLRA